jgi:hypothetical protein
MKRVSPTCCTSCTSGPAAVDSAARFADACAETPRLVQVETDAGPVELLLEKVATLGRGRGARVDLMRDLRRGRLIAEKVFRTGWGVSSLLTHALYRGCF